MASMDHAQGVNRRPLAVAGAVAGASGALVWRALRLMVYGALVIAEPVVRFCFTTIALLGMLAAVVLEFSGSAPHFPFWQALLFFGCCGMVPLVYRGILRLLAS